MLTKGVGACRRQEAFEKELEKCSVRRNPLGWDRKHRRYWWGLAGERSVIYLEDGDGRIGLLTHPSQLDALLEVLDARGLRESGLLASCEKVGPRPAHSPDLLNGASDCRTNIAQVGGLCSVADDEKVRVQGKTYVAVLRRRTMRSRWG
jgi:hypothetical protein